MKQPYLEAGRIINIHGFKGAVKLESWCDTPAVLAGLKRLWLQTKEGYVSKRVLHASVFKQFVIAHLEGVDSEDAANRLRGTVVYAAREELPLPEGGCFIADLIGLPVKHADTGAVLGTLTKVDPRAHGDLYTVETPNGEALLPAVEPFIVRIDTNDAVYIRPIPGLLDGGAEQV
ncbi:MAG: 16S rRNA processing protein RimM [Ruminococcaceae bacterium]|nr:16S rRNA processing protein RimM [Oscillospiraceae bacterium]